MLGRGAAGAVCTDGMGCVDGTHSDAAVAYLGLRFAAEPTGANRWKAPQPAAPMSSSPASPFQATQHMPCLQSSDSTSFFGTEAGCLTLDVYVPPGSTAADRLPVMVWVSPSFIFDLW